MYLFYIDESGNTGADLDHEGEPIHWLISVGVRAVDVPAIENALQEIAEEYCFPACMSPDFEFHGGDIFHGRGEFASLTPDERVRLYESVLDQLAAHDCHIAIRGIHKHRHRDRAAARNYDPDHPHKLGFMYLAEQVDQWLERQQPEPPEEPALGLLVADEQRSANRAIIERFPAWRDRGTDHGYATREIQYLIDTIHTVPSHDSWMIQLADCVAFIRNRWRKISTRMQEEHPLDWVLNRDAVIGELDRGEEAVRQLYEGRIEPSVYFDRVWPGP